MSVKRRTAILMIIGAVAVIAGPIVFSFPKPCAECDPDYHPTIVTSDGRKIKSKKAVTEYQEQVYDAGVIPEAWKLSALDLGLSEDIAIRRLKKYSIVTDTLGSENDARSVEFVTRNGTRQRLTFGVPRLSPSYVAKIEELQSGRWVVLGEIPDFSRTRSSN